METENYIYKGSKQPRKQLKKHTLSSERQELPIVLHLKISEVQLGFKKGQFDKFWVAKVVKSELHTRFGRTGTKGRNSIKKFKSRKEAMTALHEKISEKKKKGYQEI